MPKIAKELGPLAVSRLSGQGLRPVGGVAGLNLKIDGASRSWVLRVMVGRQRRHLGLGAYPAVGVAQARKKAQELREDVTAGGDPLRKRAVAKAALKASQHNATTFESAARAFISDHERSWTNAKHGAQWLSTLKTWAFPHIGSLHIEDLTTSHVLEVLRQPVGQEGTLWSARAETASRVRQRIEQIISAADAGAGRDRLNPARLDVIGRTLPKTSKVRRLKHHPALPWRRLPYFMAELETRSGVANKALAWTILTAARSGETRGMTWAELDLPAKLWTVPAKRMKSGREHRIPLSAEALNLLGAVGAPDELVFVSSGGKPLSDMTLAAVIKRMHQDASAGGVTGYTDPLQAGRVVTVHGMRSSFRDWAGEATAHPREVVEAALAHRLGDAAEQAYARSDLFEKRRQLMDDWGAYSHGS